MNPTIDPTDESPLDEPVEPTAPMLAGGDLMDRFQTAAAALDELAQHAAPSGLTQPDAGATERWEAGQVWSHIAEVVPYWHRQVESVIAGFDGTPVPFGRMKTDPDRLAGIEMGKTEPIADLAARTAVSTQEARRYLETLTPIEWSAKGLHPVRGEMDVEQIVETFLVDHLEEHVDQLNGLRAS
jgi:DinB superfamily